MALGPSTPGFIADIDLARQLAEVGVMLLMFGVGLHFSLDDLLSVRRIAVPGAVLQMVLATALGMGVALAWGWSPGAALVFGLSLCVASTVVLTRVLADNRALHTPTGHIAIGWLIVEDIIMIVALVMIPALSGSATGGGSGGVLTPILIAIGKAGLFVAIMELAGRKLLQL